MSTTRKELDQRLELGRGVSPAATASQLGESFQYVLDRPVTLPRQKSALLPIVQKDVEAARVSVYNAAPFQFGEPRDSTPTAAPRVVLETWTNDEEASQRVSLTPGEAFRLARILVHCADELTFVHHPA